MVEAIHLDAYECAACGEIFILDFDAAEACCEDVEEQRVLRGADV